MSLGQINAAEDVAHVLFDHDPAGIHSLILAACLSLQVICTPKLVYNYLANDKNISSRLFAPK